MSRSLQIRYSSAVISKQKEGGNIKRNNLETCLFVKLNIALVVALCVCVCVYVFVCESSALRQIITQLQVQQAESLKCVLCYVIRYL